MRWEGDHEWRVCKDLEQGGRGLFEGTVLVFAWRDRKPLAMLPGNSAEIRIAYFLSTSLYRYPYINLLSS